MALRAGDLIDQAKLLASPTGFTAGVSPTQLMAHLSNLDNDILELVNQIMPSLASKPGIEITCNGALNPVGYDLDPALGYTDFKYTDSQDKVSEIYVVMEVDFISPSRHPACMLTQGIGKFRTLVPADPLGLGWESSTDRSYFKPGDKITYRYIPLPTSLTALDDELQAPDFARNYLVQSCAGLILQMLGGESSQIEGVIQREQLYYRTFMMQLYKQARIHTPNQADEGTFMTPYNMRII